MALAECSIHRASRGCKVLHTANILIVLIYILYNVHFVVSAWDITLMPALFQEISHPEWPALMIEIAVISLNIGFCWGTDGRQSPAQCSVAEQIWTFGRSAIVVAGFSRVYKRRVHVGSPRQRCFLFKLFIFAEARHHFSPANENRKKKKKEKTTTQNSLLKNNQND